jgi:arabinogalactan oligomer/maltooligosaccharide transport system permease protein
VKCRKRIGLFFLNIFFILICLLCLIPVLYALGISLNSHNDLLSSNFSLISKSLTFDNYRSVLFEKPFFLWLKNSLILSAFTVLISILVAVPGAYALSRKRFRGRKTILNLLILLNAFPAILSMFAIYRILKPLGLINSFTGLILIYIGTMAIFGLWNMKGYFDTIPEEIEEAGEIDGAGDFQLIWKIVLPLARPSIIVTAVMILIYVWNEYIFAVTFITSSGKYTLAAGLYALQATDYTRNWPVFSAASLLVSIPVLIIFFCIQRYMTSGLTAGGVKE